VPPEGAQPARLDLLLISEEREPTGDASALERRTWACWEHAPEQCWLLMDWRPVTEKLATTGWLLPMVGPDAPYEARGDQAVPVSAVCLMPSMWGPEPQRFEHQGQGVMFLLEGARETRKPSACLFPETLKSEFHGIRSVIEAYSQAATLEGMEEATACGLALTKGAAWSHVFRVTSAGRTVDYRLDRWD
jgi:hypothetical protein